MEKNSFEKIIQRITKYNKSGDAFFGNGEKLISNFIKKFNLTKTDLDFSKGSLEVIDDNIYRKNLYETGLRKKLIEEFNELILFYNMEVHKRKFQRLPAFVKNNEGFCPILIDKKK